jgi:hypothetical protein
MADFLENDQKWAREERKQIKCISLVCTVHTHTILYYFLFFYRGGEPHGLERNCQGIRLVVA